MAELQHVAPKRRPTACSKVYSSQTVRNTIRNHFEAAAVIAVFPSSDIRVASQRQASPGNLVERYLRASKAGLDILRGRYVADRSVDSKIGVNTQISRLQKFHVDYSEVERLDLNEFLLAGKKLKGTPTPGLKVRVT